MAAGDSDNMLWRLKSLIPARWFAYTAPLRDAVLGGLADQLAWLYGLVGYARAQTRLATMTGPWLDLFAKDYFGRILRREGRSDDTFRRRISVELLRERVTRAGMTRALTDLTGQTPEIFEPWNTGDTGGWDTGAFAFSGDDVATPFGGGFDVAAGWDIAGSWLFDQGVYSPAISSAGAGAWGDTDLPGQVFITAFEPGLQGVPGVDGYDGVIGGWDVGAVKWIDDSMIVGQVTVDDIYDVIVTTKPTGVIAWTRLLYKQTRLPSAVANVLDKFILDLSALG